MVTALTGESRTGKSSIVNALISHVGAAVITGKDYLKKGNVPGEA